MQSIFPNFKKVYQINVKNFVFELEFTLSKETPILKVTLIENVTNEGVRVIIGTEIISGDYLHKSCEQSEIRIPKELITLEGLIYFQQLAKNEISGNSENNAVLFIYGNFVETTKLYKNYIKEGK